MTRSVSIVEYKVMQADFFLSQIKGASLDFFAVQCFTDAFASSVRSITFALQSVLADLPEFAAWYAPRQAAMRRDPLARFFNRYRSVSAHVGDTVVRLMSSGWDADGMHRTLYYFHPTQDLPEVPDGDVASACATYFRVVLSVVFESFSQFRNQLDDRWYYTQENLTRMGKTVEDAEEELGFPRGWTAGLSSCTAEERLRLLRKTQTVGCQINGIFDEHLGRVIDGPDDTSDEDV